jgi:hypothetical protein
MVETGPCNAGVKGGFMSVNLDGYNIPHSGMAKEKIDKRLASLEERVDELVMQLKNLLEKFEKSK